MTPETFEELTGRSLASFARQCHAASLALVKAGVGKRVLRGTCRGVGGQHSWVLMSGDVYSPDAVILDPTLWSYDPAVTGTWEGRARLRAHRPHGYGSIWQWGCPESGGGETIKLRSVLSREAETFLAMIGPMDYQAWAMLTNAPCQGWPAGEVFAAMADDPRLSALVPIDKLGMLTDRNPGKLYMRD